VLEGITLQSVFELAREELGLEVIERTIDRTELYVADEVFLTGTAAHLSPVIEVDRRRVGDGGIGPITSKLQKLFFDCLRGRNQKYAHWVHAVSPVAEAAAVKS
jgi:branched-chain amino acid aminotransferase